MRMFQDYLDSGDALGRLSAQARRLVELDRAYADAAPELLCSASGVARVEAGTIYLWARDGAVAAKLRQLAPMLLAKLRKRAPECTAIRVTVRLRGWPADAPAGVPRALGSGGSAALRELAESLPASPLRSALTRLASRGSHRSKDGK
jgi:hypothetical protein